MSRLIYEPLLASLVSVYICYQWKNTNLVSYFFFFFFNFRDVSFKVLEKMVPTWMGNQVGVFKSAAQTSSEFGKCKKYTCQK